MLRFTLTPDDNDAGLLHPPTLTHRHTLTLTLTLTLTQRKAWYVWSVRCALCAVWVGGWVGGTKTQNPKPKTVRCVRVCGSVCITHAFLPSAMMMMEGRKRAWSKQCMDSRTDTLSSTESLKVNECPSIGPLIHSLVSPFMHSVVHWFVHSDEVWCEYVSM